MRFLVMLNLIQDLIVETLKPDQSLSGRGDEGIW